MALELAKDALKSLLESGNISRAVYVDDVFTFRGEADVEQILGWFAQALAKSQEKALSLVKVTYPVPDDDIWRTELRGKWGQFSVDERANIVEGLSEILNSQLTKDKQVASQLSQLFPAGFDYREISPSDWFAQRSHILADMPKSSRVICIFDQDLSAEASFTDKGTLSGGGLLKNLIDNYDQPNLLCGILSHTISSIEVEHNYHKTFASEYQIGDLDPQKYLPLAKARLSDPIKFVDGFKKLLLHNLCEIIKASVLEVLDTAHRTAIDKIRSLDIYAFDRIIFQAAHQANEWEIETIVRLFQNYQRNDVRLRLANPEIAVSLNSLITEARPTSQVKTVVEEFIYPRVREIRREELYEKADLIRYRPIETGDIFVTNGEATQQKYYILLAQPCDLAVRRDGTRIRKYVSLVPIVSVNNKYRTKQTRSKWKDFWSTRAVIDNFFDDSEKLAVLEFKDAIAIKTAVLDLAVLDSNGFCKIDVTNVVIPSHLTEGWQLLLKNWTDYYSQLDADLQRVKNFLDAPGLVIEEKDKLRQITLPEFFFSEDFPKVNYSNKTFDFNLKRNERYRQPGADGLLKAYTQFLSREAKDFDFSG
mgnify:CR=1 FL=1